MQGNDPGLTVFTTVYNVSPYLPRFFACMAAQTYRDYVLLIIDDGSEDDTLAICRRYAVEDGRIRIIALAHEGISAARMVALSSIDTPFAASADADDVYEPDYLRHLVEAQEKYDADLVISRVIYRKEDYTRKGGFVERGEQYIPKEDFQREIPKLLDERRLNFLYGKLYKTELLKGCAVESDVKMGSDTMINAQNVTRIAGIALIDDEDANYINYMTRSVTSYVGSDYFERLARINRFIAEVFKGCDFWSDELEHVIDGRMLQSANWTIDRLGRIEGSLLSKYFLAHEVLNSHDYRAAYDRQAARLSDYRFRVIAPENTLEEVNYALGLMTVRKSEYEHLKREVEQLRTSNSYRIGRAITFPVRMAKLACRALYRKILQGD